MLGKVQVTGKLTLREIRSLHNMTQKEFSEFVDIPLSTYQRYETTLEGADFIKVAQICKKSGISIDNIAY